MKRYSKQQIISSVSILDVAIKFGIGLQPVCSGNFTHRCFCPSPDHKNGSERTPSLYIDSNKNNFFCFGCTASHNVIDFYILCSGKDFSQTISDLSELVDPDNVSAHVVKNVPSNFLILIKISEVIRKAHKEHPEDREWIDMLMKKTDLNMKSIDRSDVARAKSLLKKIKALTGRRYHKK